MTNNVNAENISYTGYAIARAYMSDGKHIDMFVEALAA